ncbi:pyridoxal-dependent decarboxylase [Candidatus Uhrbacteria bacterium]|nr:pyridoxal-dependent decarboxylase [Candidatus Uhrbacteria bacterium]
MSLKLTPLIHEEVVGFLKNQDRLFELIRYHGSPLNLLFPNLMSENIARFQTVLERNMDRSQIYYAHKPNKSVELLQTGQTAGIGVDVASFKELNNALQTGISPKNIEATGPKNDLFIKQGVEAEIVFNIDSLTELALVIQESKNQSKKTRVYLRLNGFSAQHTNVRWSESRFGILIKDLPVILQQLINQKDFIQLIGFSFHINAGGKKERLIAIENSIECTLAARKLGLNPQFINIGGGFHISYLAHQEEWHDYISALKRSVLGHVERLSWNDSGLGYKNRSGALEGGPNFGEFYHELVKERELEDLLNEKLPTYNLSVKTILNEMLIGLAIEPGRALLDQVGVTVAEVLDVKETSSGDQVVIVDMNRSNINAIDMELMFDPLLVSQEQDHDKPFFAFIAGNLCLHSDLIYRHKTFFPHQPHRGDLLVFVNTGAYNMNFAESATLGQPVAKTVIVKDKTVCSTET